jgi:hypothetical protein
MSKADTLTSWPLQQAAAMFEISHRGQQRKIATLIRQTAREFIACAHSEAKLQDNRQDGQAED